jgi:hypothetical protein
LEEEEMPPRVQLLPKTVSQFLSQEDLSTYHLPSIQRDFVWGEDDVLELIDSLLRGYPIGVITILETDIPFPSIPLLDVGRQEGGGTILDGQQRRIRRYILDGQQRLTSLLLIRDGWRITRNGRTIQLKPIHFNPDASSDAPQEMRLRIKGKREFGEDFSKLVRWALHMELPPPNLASRTIELLRRINDEFLLRELGFHVIRVLTWEMGEVDRDRLYEDMGEIFTRINRAGIRLGNLEMFLSFYASRLAGKELISQIYEEMSSSYNLDLEPIIRVVFSNLGLSQNQISKVKSFKRGIDTLRQKYGDNEQQIREIIEESRSAIRVTMEMLHEELGITDANRLLPSQTSLVVLFKYIAKRGYTSTRDIPERDKKAMLRWFILSSFFGLYSSHTDDRLEEDLRKLEGSDSFPVNGLLDAMRSRNLRVRIEKQDLNIDFNILRGTAGRRFLFLLYILLHKNGATDWAGKNLKDNRNLAIHHILPKENEKVREVLRNPETWNHLGNLTFIDRGRNEQIGDSMPEDYLPTIDSRVLEEHFIPTDRLLWKPERYEEFIERRMDTIRKALEDYMNALEST